MDLLDAKVLLERVQACKDSVDMLNLVNAVALAMHKRAWKGLVPVAFDVLKILPGATCTANVMPYPSAYELPLLPRALLIPEAVAASVDVVSLRVGKNSVFVSFAPIPGTAFVHPSPTLPRETPLLRPNMYLTLAVQNTGEDPVSFQPMIMCEPRATSNKKTIDFGAAFFGGRAEDLDDEALSLPKLIAPDDPRIMPNDCAGGCGRPARRTQFCAQCRAQELEIGDILCAGGCGRAARLGMQLCAQCAGPE